MEVLVVVSIVAILSTIGLLNYKKIIDNSKRGATLDEVKEYALQEGIARGDTGVFWKLQDLQSSTMPNLDVYNRPINTPNAQNNINLDTTLWQGPYLSLQKTAGTDLHSKFDSEGYPLDFWGNRYQLALLSTQNGTTTLLDFPNAYATSASNPDIAVVISWGPDKYPGIATDGIAYDLKTTSYWLYYNEVIIDPVSHATTASSDDIYYKF